MTQISRSKSSLEVWKFGGAALADARAIHRAVDRIVEHDGPLVVVASAMAGVTDLLLSADPEAGETLRRTHMQAARALIAAGPARRRLQREIAASAREYHDVCVAMRTLGELSPRALDTLAARGEQLSAKLLAAALIARRRRAAYVDALDIILTNGIHGGATPLFAKRRRRRDACCVPCLAGKRLRSSPASSAAPTTAA